MSQTEPDGNFKFPKLGLWAWTLALMGGTVALMFFWDLIDIVTKVLSSARFRCLGPVSVPRPGFGA